MSEVNENISLEELAKRIPITILAQNICMRNGLTTLGKLNSYYYENKNTFKGLRGCGIRVESELVELLNKYFYQIKDVQNEVLSNKIVQTYKALTPFKKIALTHHIKYLLRTLSARALNGLNQQFGSSLFTDLFNSILEAGFDFNSIRNIGEKTGNELNILRDKLILFVDFLKELDEKNLSKEYTKLILLSEFPNISDNSLHYIETIFDANGKIMLFKLINILITESVIFKSNEKSVFNLTYKLADLSTKSPNEIAKELNLTKERIRQLKINLENEVETYFEFILNLNKIDINNYEIENQSQFIVIDENKIKIFNENEQVHYNIKFYSIILGLFLKASHSLLGSSVIFGKRKTKNARRFKKCYLIEKSIFEKFNFEKFLEDVYLKLNEKNSDSYSLYFEGYLFDFFIGDRNKLFIPTRDICEQILFHEFDLIIDSNGFLLLERTTRKLAYEYAYEILNDSNRLMTVDEIYTSIIDKYGELEITSASVRASLQRDKEHFMFIGRSSTYGLRKWEMEQINMKGGTIRDIVEEYLNSENEPKHIFEIMKVVSKYRETNEKNVLSNIKLEDNERFCFHEGGFIGIRGKLYSTEKLNFTKLTGSRFTRVFLRKFHNQKLQDVIDFYVSKYNYKPVQLLYMLQKKEALGEIKIVNDLILLQ
ncbi:MAG: hypothetical protein P4L35_19455 [Ignavibacteriaceae bacterium]|nr:hypothetical protein [Ignavibacteriaceae bacterium]